MEAEQMNSLPLCLSFHHCQHTETYCCHKMSTWCSSPAHTDAHHTLPVYVSTVAYQWSCVKPSNRSIWSGEMAVKLLLFQQYYTTAPTSNNMIILVIVWKVFIPRASADAVANNVLCPLSGGYDSVILWSWDIKLLPHHHYSIISQITNPVYFPKPRDNNLIITVFRGIIYRFLVCITWSAGRILHSLWSPERERHPRGEELNNDRWEWMKPTYNIMTTSGCL